MCVPRSHFWFPYDEKDNCFLKYIKILKAFFAPRKRGYVRLSSYSFSSSRILDCWEIQNKCFKMVNSEPLFENNGYLNLMFWTTKDR